MSQQVPQWTKVAANIIRKWPPGWHFISKLWSRLYCVIYRIHVQYYTVGEWVMTEMGAYVIVHIYRVFQKVPNGSKLRLKFTELEHSSIRCLNMQSFAPWLRMPRFKRVLYRFSIAPLWNWWSKKNQNRNSSANDIVLFIPHFSKSGAYITHNANYSSVRVCYARSG